MKYVFTNRTAMLFLDDMHHKGLNALEPGSLVPPGIWTLADVQQYGRENTLCPYFAIRRMVGFCRIAVAS